MTEAEKRLSCLPDIHEEDLKRGRSLLKDLAAETLRDHISSGRIPEGTKLTEREVSRLLGISRMPARDALMSLEAEGLVVSRSDGRYVIELTEKDVRDIHVLRWTLERLAAELAAAHTSEENRAALRARLRDLEEAAASGDPVVCTKCDIALHQTIWQQADNAHVLRVLDSMLGVIYVLCNRVEVYGSRDFERLLNEHRELVKLIASGDGPGAGQAIEASLRHALAESLHTFQISDQGGLSV